MWLQLDLFKSGVYLATAGVYLTSAGFCYDRWITDSRQESGWKRTYLIKTTREGGCFTHNLYLGASTNRPNRCFQRGFKSSRLGPLRFMRFSAGGKIAHLRTGFPRKIYPGILTTRSRPSRDQRRSKKFDEKCGKKINFASDKRSSSNHAAELGGGIALAPLPETEWEDIFFYHMCLQTRSGAR
jgi:hypothetical protein